MSDEKLNASKYMIWKSEGKNGQDKVSRVHPMRRKKSDKDLELPNGTRFTPGQVVAMKRKELGLSQEQLAEKIGLSRIQISRIERNENIPLILSIEELEAVLGIELYDLFVAQKREQSKGENQS